MKKISSGFTLIEVIVVTAIVFVLFSLSAVSFSQLQKSHLLNDQAWQIITLLRQSQSQAVSGEAIDDDHLYFGIVFTNNSYLEFKTITDFNSRETEYDLTTELSDKLSLININLPNNCLAVNDCILFSPIEGTPSASGSFSLTNQADGAVKTIYINDQGKVSF